MISEGPSGRTNQIHQLRKWLQESSQRAEPPTAAIDPARYRSNWRLVRAAGVEPTTFGFGGRRSIQLSYARNILQINNL